MHQIKETLLGLITEMPKSGDSRREVAWREYQRVRALQSTLQDAFEKLTN